VADGPSAPAQPDRRNGGRRGRQHGWNEKPQTTEAVCAMSVSPDRPCQRDGRVRRQQPLSGSSFRDEVAETGFCLTIGLNSLSAFAQGLSAERACRQNPTMITLPPTPEESVPACGRRVRKRVAMIVFVVACHISPGRFTGPPWSEPHNWQLAS
jgi:hypothetical protein